MKKVLLVLIALMMIVVDCEDANAKNNLLEELINVVGKHQPPVILRASEK